MMSKGSEADASESFDVLIAFRLSVKNKPNVVRTHKGAAFLHRLHEKAGIRAEALSKKLSYSLPNIAFEILIW